jgi:hypothetical protein
VQNGLSLGYRITGDEWRILGKEVKVELWVQNHSDKDVKFQLNLRDPDIRTADEIERMRRARSTNSNIVSGTQTAVCGASSAAAWPCAQSKGVHHFALFA